MYFQFLDRKSECKTIFLNGSLQEYQSALDTTHTWAFHPLLKDRKVEFGSLYAQGKGLEDCCPESLLPELKTLKQQHQAYLRSFKESKVFVNDHCLEELIPESFLINYFNFKNKVTQHVLETYPKPVNYDHLVGLSYLVHKIEHNKLNLDMNILNKKIYDPKALLLKKKISKTEPFIKYNIFGTITGRFTTKKTSFPILTLNKEFRDIIKPKNDWFVELDYNSAELRTFLGLNGKKQPDKDIHSWHQNLYEDFFGEALNRADAKQKFFAWFYGGKSRFSSIPVIREAYDKDSIIQQYWDGQKIINPYGRVIEADLHHAFNAVIQSTTSDLFLRKAIEINQMLEGLRSFISFMIHDNLVIDFCKDDRKILKNILACFQDTKLGKFKANVKIGPILSEMREV